MKTILEFFAPWTLTVGSMAGWEFNYYNNQYIYIGLLTISAMMMTYFLLEHIDKYRNKNNG